MSTEQQLRERIAELEAQLESVGAGGVQPLAPQQEAPAEREPLSETELNRFFDMLKANPQTEWWTDLQWFQSGCVAAEAAHGITGGQHGAE